MRRSVYIQSISIKRLLCLFILLCSLSKIMAQENGYITGSVTDASGEPIVGAVIGIVENKQKTVTDIDGKFSIKAIKGQTITVSFIGMRTFKESIKTTALKVVLQNDSKMIDEVVVTGYQNIRNRVYTGASTAVKMTEIKLEGVGDVSRMLEGRVPGLSIQNISGTFGAAPRINIRGGASIMGNVQPLWVIDGAVYEDLVHVSPEDLASGDAVTLISSAVAGLNPADIQDIQILKDASATSVYGARAANGVIVITTKSGKRESPLQINYTTENTWRPRPDYSHFDLLNSQETMALYQEMQEKGYFDPATSLYGRRGGVYHQMYKQLTTYDEKTNNRLLLNTEEARKKILRQREYANTDWFQILFANSLMTNHTLSLSAGGKKVASYASIGYYHDAGWTIADQVQRLTTNIKNTFYITNNLTAKLSLQGNMRLQNAPGTLPQKKNTISGAFERDFDINPFAYALGTSRTLRPYDENGKREYYRNNWAPFNILNEYDNNHLKIRVVDFKLQTEATYKFTDALNLKTMFSYRRAHTSTQHEIGENSNIIGAYRACETPWVANQNIYLVKDIYQPGLMPKPGIQQGGILFLNNADMQSMLARIAIDYDKQIGSHDLKGFAFGEIRTLQQTISSFKGYGISYQRGNEVQSAPGIFDKMFQENNPYFALRNRDERGVTFSGNATYGYKGKYIFNTVVNIEGSNAAGRGATALWLPTWNVGAKWNVDKEKFMQDNNAISKLAFRISYGLTAKMNEAAANASVIYKGGIAHRLNLNDRENKLNLISLENRDLTWEKMYELNIGADMAFFNNRISATIDVYQRNTFDLIDLVRTSGVGGQYYKYANFGDMVSRGIEIGLHTTNISTNSWKWSTDFTFSAINQKITRMLNSPNAFDMVAGRGRGNVVGYPKGSLFSFNFQKLDKNGLPNFNFGRYPLPQNELKDIVGADFNDTQYTKTYLLYHGPIEPNIVGGLANTVKWHNWELSCFITMQAGNKIRLNPTFDMQFADLNVFSKNYLNRWLNPGDEYHTDVPTLPSKEIINIIGIENIEKAYNTYNYSQLRVADGSFVRLKNIALSYLLKEKWMKTIGLKSGSLRFNVTNPLLIYADPKLHGQDPEYYQTGGVSLPTPIQYTFTLNVGF